MIFIEGDPAEYIFLLIDGVVEAAGPLAMATAVSFASTFRGSCLDLMVSGRIHCLRGCHEYNDASS
jgi:hypothetical protein